MSFLLRVQQLTEANRQEPVRAPLSQQMRWGEEFYRNEKLRSIRVADWAGQIISAAELGEREQRLYIGVVGDPYMPALLKLCEHFVAEEGFAYELATAFYRTESRGEFLTERYVLVTW